MWQKLKFLLSMIETVNPNLKFCWTGSPMSSCVQVSASMKFKDKELFLRSHATTFEARMQLKHVHAYRSCRRLIDCKILDLNLFLLSTCSIEFCCLGMCFISCWYLQLLDAAAYFMLTF
ncbi:uncharacterized protein A4U43_C08F34920 [Asparagus officinalis]|nr:uncharacterized protein A4U43_C08F34920 [Asparagus officinalis]